jgi:hypothetical protein
MWARKVRPEQGVYDQTARFYHHGIYISSARQDGEIERATEARTPFLGPACSRATSS